MQTITRSVFISRMEEHYGISPDYPWEGDFVDAVFRHYGNKKWFALLMTIKGKKLNRENKEIDVVNLKCEPQLIEILTKKGGAYERAYHMNKQKWLSVVLNEVENLDEFYGLVDLSFELTK